MQESADLLRLHTITVQRDDIIEVLED